jgi:hypothetical protein
MKKIPKILGIFFLYIDNTRKIYEIFWGKIFFQNAFLVEKHPMIWDSYI